ncbi:single-stranded DNA-binding protein [Limibacter armeniacum]|uniref:single-stranded DNA-binding protein n=1 Tax=Limibacter armeniacum TaxID=466084 RepID=UPI002FE6415C
MANGVNKVILIGHLGKDPEVRHLEIGSSVATFPIATTESYLDREGNKQSMTEWHNIVLWRGLAKVAEQYLKKGSKIYVEGRLTSRSYEKDGITRYVTEVVGREMLMLDTRGDAHPPMPEAEHEAMKKSTSEALPTAPAEITGDDPDDLPF